MAYKVLLQSRALGPLANLLLQQQTLVDEAADWLATMESEAKDLPRAERCFQQALQTGLKPDMLAAQDWAQDEAVIKGYCREGNLEMAKEWLERAKVSYNSLLKAAVVAGNMDHTQDYLEEMESRKLRPSLLTYGTLVSAYADSGDVQSAQRWYDKALTGRGKSNVFLLAVLLKAYVKAGDLAGAENCIKKADEAGVAPNHVVFTTMVNAYAEKGDVDSALVPWTV
eukprot:Skav219864  [mRNA]  locus=scaffold777:17751:25197:+ [translate_table: standard]